MSPKINLVGKMKGEIMDMRCLTDKESELYEKSLNEEATETGINLFTVKSFTPTIKTNMVYASPFIDKTAEATGKKFKLTDQK